MDHPTPVTRAFLPPLEEYMEELRPIWDSHWMTNMGQKHRQLQTELERYLHVPHVTLCTNGHMALENAISVLALPRGSEVITTPFTFASTTHAIVRSGLVPVFCDINDRDYTIDVSQLECLITDRTSAILPVHVYGNLCDTAAIQHIAEAHGLRVIYDAAHAFGVTRDGVSPACFGDMAIFSFHATKVFNTIEGGAICYRDDSLSRPLDDRKNFGIRGPEDVVYPGGNAKMTEFQAAMGLCNLRHIRGQIELRKKAAARYTQRLSGIEGIRLCPVPENTEHNYSYFPVVFDSYRYTRDEIFSMLLENGIAARKYFYPLTNDFACYRDYPTAGAEKTPVARHIAQSVLTLPLYAELSVDEIDRICDIILS